MIRNNQSSNGHSSTTKNMKMLEPLNFTLKQIGGFLNILNIFKYDKKGEEGSFFSQWNVKINSDPEPCTTVLVSP